MIQLGRTQQLKIDSLQPHGAYLVDAGAELPPLPAAYGEAALDVDAPAFCCRTTSLTGRLSAIL